MEEVIFNDAESARSESSLSDDEYEEIRYKYKKKKVKTNKIHNLEDSAF